MAGGRRSRPAPPPRPHNTLVIDNGASTLKLGNVPYDSSDQPRVVPNCIARDRYKKIYVSEEIEKCRDFSEIQLRRPVDSGFVVNWEAQREIWDRQFLDEGSPLRCDPAETRLLLAEPPNGLPVIQSNCDQIVFEEYGFASYYRGVGPSFNAYHDVQNLFRTPQSAPGVANTPAEVLLVIDSGYSHSTVTPVLSGRPIQSAIRRLDVGGKLLTNHLARLLSLRHFDMRNETYIVNEMKEQACYVSADFKNDLERTWKGTRGDRRQEFLTGAGIAKDYVLPDFHSRSKGLLLDYDPARHSKARRVATSTSADEDALTLRNERFAVPEVIFNPTDVGIRQPGLPDVIHESLQSLPIGLWPGLLANVVVVGGNTLFDGFIQRLQKELIQRFPDDCVVRVARPSNPITSTWHGAANLANHSHIEKLSITKKDYEENGASWVTRRFSKGLSDDGLFPERTHSIPWLCIPDTGRFWARDSCSRHIPACAQPPKDPGYHWVETLTCLVNDEGVVTVLKMDNDGKYEASGSSFPRRAPHRWVYAGTQYGSKTTHTHNSNRTVFMSGKIKLV